MSSSSPYERDEICFAFTSRGARIGLETDWDTPERRVAKIVGGGTNSSFDPADRPAPSELRTYAATAGTTIPE